MIGAGWRSHPRSPFRTPNWRSAASSASDARVRISRRPVVRPPAGRKRSHSVVMTMGRCYARSVDDPPARSSSQYGDLPAKPSPQELGFFAAAAFLNSVAQAAENLLRSRLLLMQACISEPACLPHNLLASFLQSCDTELLDEDEGAGADAAAGGAVCAYAVPTIAKETTSASDRTFIFIPSFVCGATRKTTTRLYATRAAQRREFPVRQGIAQCSS